MRIGLVLVLLFAACGDGAGGDDEMPGGPCEPPAAELPESGKYIDPQAIPIDGDCKPDGLRDLPGRWFVVDPSQYFQFEYPKYVGSCSTGFSRLGVEDDHDASDGYTLYTWSDGTRYFQRAAYEFQGVTYIFVYAACMTGDDTLAATYLTYDQERGEQITHATGERFAPIDEPPALGLSLIGELNNVGQRPLRGLNLVVDGQRAYLAGTTGLDIIDVSDPTAPQAIGYYPGSWNDVRVVNDGTHVVAFLSPYGSEDRTQFVDVTDPSAPQRVGLLEEYSHSLQVQERGDTKLLYLATYNQSVPRYDVTNPLTPVRQGMAIVPGEESGVHDLYVDGDKIYACNTQQGLVAFDTSGGFGSSNVELGRFTLGYSHAAWAGTIGGRPIILAGDEGMTRTPSGGAHLSILDGDPQSPTFMQELAIYQTRPQVGIHYFEVHGDLVYIAYYHDGVRVIDLSDPTQPREIAHFDDWQEEEAYGDAFEGALAVRKVGDLLYVADLERGLLVLRED